jgi:hypothetical protein
MAGKGVERPSTFSRVAALFIRFPFTIWAICALAILEFLNMTGAEYDSLPLGLLVITNALWAWMYWAPSEFLFEFNEGRAIAYHHILSVVVGLLIVAGADTLLGALRSRARRVVKRMKEQ